MQAPPLFFPESEASLVSRARQSAEMPLQRLVAGEGACGWRAAAAGRVALISAVSGHVNYGSGKYK